MSNNRNRRQANYQQYIPPAGFPEQVNARGQMGQGYGDPDRGGSQMWQARQAPTPQGPYWGQEGSGGYTEPNPYPQYYDEGQANEFRGPASMSDGYYAQSAAVYPMPYQQPPHNSYQDQYGPGYSTHDEMDQPIIQIFNQGTQAPMMGLILMTSVIMMIVFGLGIFWLIGGDGFENMAERAGASTAANAIQPLVDPSTHEGQSSSPIVPTGQLAPFFAPSVLYWEQEIINWAARHNLDPNMVATVMQIESCGDPQAVSRAGATGLFQVMPFHFVDGEDPFNPDTNALRGMNYLAERLIQTNGDVGKAFAGYNGGHVAAAGSWDSWVDETRRYFTWSTGIYDEASRGLTSSETLTRWYAAGGNSLCAQAEARLNIN